MVRRSTGRPMNLVLSVGTKARLRDLAHDFAPEGRRASVSAFIDALAESAMEEVLIGRTNQVGWALVLPNGHHTEKERVIMWNKIPQIHTGLNTSTQPNGTSESTQAPDDIPPLPAETAGRYRRIPRARSNRLHDTFTVGITESGTLSFTMEVRKRLGPWVDLYWDAGSRLIAIEAVPEGTEGAHQMHLNNSGGSTWETQVGGYVSARYFFSEIGLEWGKHIKRFPIFRDGDMIVIKVPE